MISYKSDYPNQVHQLNFSISQNHYLLKNGDIKYQEKKFDINWKNYEKTGKRHLVNYLIRDHFSNCFYAEIHPIEKLPTISEFLFNAWKEKKIFEFCGIPKNIILGKHILEKFPNLYNFEKNTGTHLELAINGFATGIRSVRDWENNIRFYTFFRNYSNIIGFQENIETICKHLNMKDSGKSEINLIKWIDNNPKGRLINDKIEFDRYFI